MTRSSVGVLRKTYWNAFTVWHARDEERLPYRSLDEIVGLQAKRVRAIVAHAYENVPHYREVMDRAGLHPNDFRTADDLARLPIVTGEDVARAPERFLSRDHHHRDGITILSSGTSGKRKRIDYDAAALFLTMAHGHRRRVVLARFVGRKYGYREMSAIRSGSVDVQVRAFYESHSWAPGRIEFQRSILSPGDSFEENIAQLNGFRPELLRGYGTYLGALFRAAWERGLTVFRPKVVMYGGDLMPDADRRLIETEFGVPVLSGYQAVEALRMSFQCERREGFHVDLDHVAFRVVNRRGETVGPGESGDIVISNLTNRATVLLNYKLGDVVTLGRSACPCGRTLPTLNRIEGRSDDLVVLPGGEFAHSLVIMERLQAVARVVQVQLIQEDLRRFRLLVVGDPRVDRERSGRELDAALRGVLGEDLALELEWVDAIPHGTGGKARAVISHVEQNRGARPGSGQSSTIDRFSGSG
jgi:phenylacetate-CoA ligase